MILTRYAWEVGVRDGSAYIHAVHAISGYGLKAYSWSRLLTDDKEHFTGTDRLHSFLELLKEWSVECDLVFWNPDDDKAHLEFGEILLVLKTAIDRYEDIELLFGEREKRTVFATSQPNLSDGLDIVARESGPHSGVDALV